MKKALLGAAVLSAALASAGTAFAQNQHEQQARVFGPAQRVEARLAYVRTALKITDAQQPQWNAFADEVRQEAAQRAQKVKAWREEAAQRPTAIERLDRAQKMHADAIATINARLAVEKPLYDALNPEQKKIADVVLEPRPRGRFGGHRHGWGRA